MNAVLEAPNSAAPAQITELKLIVTETNEVTVSDTALHDAARILQPIAMSIPDEIAYAKTLRVTNQAEADAAVARREIMLANATLAKDTVNGFQGGIISKLHNLHRRWTAFRSLFDPLEGAAKQVKQIVIAWQEDERRKAEAEERRLQAEADERARKERERLEKQAEKLKTPELKEERLEAAAAVMAPVITVSRPTAAVKGQKRWKVKEFDLAAFLTAAANEPSLQGYIELKITNLERAKAANSALVVPGITFHQVVV